MKYTILLFIAFAIFSCSKNNDDEQPALKLPAETQTGANTFACVINDQVFYPRDGQGSLIIGGTKGLTYWTYQTSGQGLYHEIEIKNAKDGLPASDMIIHLQGLNQNGAGIYNWKSSNFQNSIDGPMHNYVYAKIYNSTSKSWRYYGSYENSGKVTITRYDFPNRICSGTFSGKLRIFNGTEEIEILNGRFDLKWSTLSTTPYP